MCLTGHATGGGHLGVTVFATGGGGGHENFFRKGDSFWRFPPLLPKRQKLSTFRKNFRVPPPVANTVTPKCPPPPVACPVRHLTTDTAVGHKNCLMPHST